MTSKPAMALFAAAVAAAGAHAQPAASAPQLADLTLEQLGSLEITSVSGRAQSLQQAAASVYVITAQDIRRSAATSLPEALRLAPNLQVAQGASGQWAITARGFQDLISNKLLVLVDGRTVYSPLFAGVFWDANDVVLEDIDRIEVISGPGGTLWGANAVNGVINIVTRPAAETQGLLASATRSARGGRETVRWGTKLGEQTHVRAYALAKDRDALRLPSGASLGDGSALRQMGFRADSPGGAGGLTVQGDFYEGGPRPATTNLAPELRGYNLLARWEGESRGGSPYQLQAYVDSYHRDDPVVFRTQAHTFDLQFTHDPRLAFGQLLWGVGHRQSRDENQATALVAFLPASRTLAWTNVFAQYQWPLAEKLQATAGVKLERNSYTGTETLPSLRVAWLHSPRATTWAAVSRVVRAPARIDREFFFTSGGALLIAGGPNFESETANVVELGHRAQFTPALSASATLFRQNFHGLRAGAPGQLPPVTVQNLVEGPVDGVEAWGQWQVNDAWRLSAGYLGLHKDLRFSGGLSPATRSFPGLGNDARSQVTLRSSLNVGPRGEFDVSVRRVGQLTDPQIPGYTSVDARLGFQASPSLRLSVLGTNLLDRRHVEFNNGGEIRRVVYLQASWQL